jgi:hypothetical protein
MPTSPQGLWNVERKDVEKVKKKNAFCGLLKSFGYTQKAC